MKSARQRETEATIYFRAKLSRPAASEKNDSFTLLTLPKNASAKLRVRGIAMVEATINGFPFRTVLESDGNGSHYLKANKAMLDATGVSVGDTVTVEITRVDDEHEIRIPIELRKALAAAPEAQAMWAEITPMARRDWILWISSAKLQETRLSRIEKACSMLESGKKRVCCFGGLNWLTKDYRASCETWIQLPKSKK